MNIFQEATMLATVFVICTVAEFAADRFGVTHILAAMQRLGVPILGVRIVRSLGYASLAGTLITSVTVVCGWSAIEHAVKLTDAWVTLVFMVTFAAGVMWKIPQPITICETHPT